MNSNTPKPSKLISITISIIAAIGFGLVLGSLFGATIFGQNLQQTIGGLITPTPQALAQSATKQTVKRVIDGDTIELANGSRVRLLQIDTPESTTSKECWGPEASNHLKQVLPPGTIISLEVDAKLDKKDKYGRLLRYVRNTKTGGLINLELVRDGFAAPYFYKNQRGTYANDLLHLADAAKQAGTGAWGQCPGTKLDATRNFQTQG
jgi:endonuclease YncB( thermonuclease family)